MEKGFMDDCGSGIEQAGLPPYGRCESMME